MAHDGARVKDVVKECQQHTFTTISSVSGIALVETCIMTIATVTLLLTHCSFSLDLHRWDSTSPVVHCIDLSWFYLKMKFVYSRGFHIKNDK